MKRKIFCSTFFLFSLLSVSFTFAHHKSHSSSESHRDCDKSGCNKVHVISQEDIPLVIKKSGEYCLKEDVVFNGSGNAITIKANNVKLNLNTFSITLKNPNATGILVINAAEIVIESDAIINKSTTQKGNGIHLLNTNKVLINNVFTLNHLNGLLIENSKNVQVLQSQFLDPTNAGASVLASTNVEFNECVFTGSANNGLIFSGPNQDCTLFNCEFPDAVFSNLLVQQMNGMLVENCLFTNNGGDPGKANLVQFGDVNTPLQVANDIIIKNCTIINRPGLGGNTAPEGLGLYNVAGVIVDYCIVDIDNTGQPQEKDLSGIHIGNGTGVQVGTNVTIRHTILQGPSTDGFYPDIGSTFVVIEDCLASGALKDGIFLAGTTSSLVQNCTVVNNGTNGIFLGETSPSNAILNNVITNNGFNIITPITDPSLPPTGNGIGIASDSSSNLIQSNKIFNNANNIQDDGVNNMFIDNTTF